MSGSRGFFYDDCRSGDRLAREYTLLTGATPTVYLDGSRLCYRWVATGVLSNNILLASFKPSGEYELTYMCKKNFAAAPLALTENYIDYRAATEWYRIGLYGEVYLTHQTPTGVPYNRYNAIAFTNNIWYKMKIRVGVRAIMMKVWQEGLAEPDWWINFKTSTVIAYGIEPRITIRRPFSSGIALGFYSVTVGDTMEISDIRITPIRKVGGP